MGNYNFKSGHGDRGLDTVHRSRIIILSGTIAKGNIAYEVGVSLSIVIIDYEHIPVLTKSIVILLDYDYGFTLTTVEARLLDVSSAVVRFITQVLQVT